jgi:hypothetical protein
MSVSIRAIWYLGLGAACRREGIVTSDRRITTVNLGRGTRRLHSRERLYDRILVHRSGRH